VSAAGINDRSESPTPECTGSNGGISASSPLFSELNTIVDRLAALLPSGVNLDDMMTPEQCARWLKLKKKTVCEMARDKVIPAVILSGTTIRFHPRTILEEGHKGRAVAKRGAPRKPFSK
jgi:excisionase family DNA binding protein